jgi:hypothetical protein
VELDKERWLFGVRATEALVDGMQTRGVEQLQARNR